MPSSEAKSLLNALGNVAPPINNIIDDLDTPMSEDLPKAFPGVSKWLPALPNTCQSLMAGVRARKFADETPQDKESYQHMTKLACECAAFANQLQTYFSAVTADEDKNLVARLERYKGRVQDDKEGRLVETVMQDILERLLKVVSALTDPNRPILEAVEAKQLQEALKDVKGLPRSLEKEAKGGNYHITNSGSGVQPVHLGERGVQQIQAGNAPQFNGDTTHANISWGFQKPPDDTGRSSRAI